MKKILLFVSLFAVFSCDEFKIHTEKWSIYAEEKDSLEILDSVKIAALISDYSVGRFVEIEKDTFFLPVNFEYLVSNVGKFNVPIGDLVITEDVNKYKPILFNSEDQDHREDSERITSLFFLPTNDSLAISRKKLESQFSKIDYIDHNSIIVGGTVYYYKYDKKRKGFELFYSIKMPMFNRDITPKELLYESVDILRMAKNLRSKKAKEFNWDKLNYVAPLHFPRYFTQPVIEEISARTRNLPENFQHIYKPENLELEVSVIKDSSLIVLSKDLKKTPLKRDYDLEDNYSPESIRILKNYLNYSSFDIEVSKTDTNTFYIEDFPGRTVLHFIPEKKILFTIKDTDFFNKYNDEIYFRYFKEVLIPKL